MPWHDVDNFLNEVCKYVKFKGAHEGITEELQNHIQDRVHDYVEGGMEEELAVKKAVEAMGNPEDIGIELNRQHRPYLGWALIVVNTLLVIFIFLTVIYTLPMFFGIFESFNQLPSKENIKYTVTVNERARIDDRFVTVKKLIVDKSNTVYIQYNELNMPYSWGWSMINFKIYDDKGTSYYPSGGQERFSIFGKRYLQSFDNINQEATKLILDYDYYNRKMRFEIPLSGGER